ncbi:hypothetical protein PS720_05921 [Pseudomonas fluorescens]|nr:hypothetical protein PS720_05921 [Pseudomonas fluorescens]
MRGWRVGIILARLCCGWSNTGSGLACDTHRYQHNSGYGAGPVARELAPAGGLTDDRHLTVRPRFKCGRGLAPDSGASVSTPFRVWRRTCGEGACSRGGLTDDRHLTVRPRSKCGRGLAPDSGASVSTPFRVWRRTCGEGACSRWRPGRRPGCWIRPGTYPLFRSRPLWVPLLQRLTFEERKSKQNALAPTLGTSLTLGVPVIRQEFGGPPPRAIHGAGRLNRHPCRFTPQIPAEFRPACLTGRLRSRSKAKAQRPDSRLEWCGAKAVLPAMQAT